MARALGVAKGGNPKVNAVAEIEAFRGLGAVVGHGELRNRLEVARATAGANLGATPIANDGGNN